MMSKHLELEKYKEEIYHCFRCGFCRELVLGGARRICPIRETLGFETTYARGRIGVARALLEEKIDYSDPLVERIYTCLGCYNCKAHCPTKVDTPSVVRAQREEIHRKGLRKFKALEEIDSKIDLHKNPYGLGKKARSRWAETLHLPKRGEILYFAGCATSFDRPGVAQSLVKILKKGGVEVAYLGEEEWCCGIPVLWNGNLSSARTLMEENLKKFKASGARTIVTSCPDCFNALDKHYPSVLGRQSFRIVHILDMILELVKSGKVNFIKELRRKITYHDPCRLGREAGIYDPPREILKSIPGVDFVEMGRNREHAWCCGGGGVVNLVYPKISIQIAKDRVQEALETGADILATCCPLCHRQLENRLWDNQMKVKDVIFLVAEAMGVESC